MSVVFELDNEYLMRCALSTVYLSMLSARFTR